jgi:inorganic pyrophosphatase
MSEPVQRFRPHPWHGLPVGPKPPETVNVFVEITPFDLMKYEVDKSSGYLRIDRPQRSSSLPPALYGFIPRTYCAERVAALMAGATKGDGDPLDVCVLTERPVTRNEILLTAHVVGGLEMLDGGEADDKILAVLDQDLVYGKAREIADLPAALVDRLHHYFSTYKLVPGGTSRAVVRRQYGRDHAFEVVGAAMEDYAAHFGALP